MRQNLSPSERDVRLGVFAPIAIIVLVSAGITTVLGIFAAVFAAAMVLSALTGHDPTYALFDAEPAEPLPI